MSPNKVYYNNKTGRIVTCSDSNRNTELLNSLLEKHK